MTFPDSSRNDFDSPALDVPPPLTHRALVWRRGGPLLLGWIGLLMATKWTLLATIHPPFVIVLLAGVGSFLLFALALPPAFTIETRPGRKRCFLCHTRLTAEERHYYGGSCNTCEAKELRRYDDA